MSDYTRLKLGRDSSGRALILNARTFAMLQAAQAMLRCKLTVIQGSYMGGAGAVASANTHAGGGTLDIRVWDLPPNVSITEVLAALRRVGFAAWHRTRAQGFDPHIHAVAIGDHELAPVAANQVKAYLHGFNGLGHLGRGGRDDGPRVPFRTWEQVQAPVKLSETTLEELLDMDENTIIVIDKKYQSNSHFDPVKGTAPADEKVPLKTLLARMYTWSHISAYGDKRPLKKK